MAFVEGCKGGPALRVLDEINFQEASQLEFLILPLGAAVNKPFEKLRPGIPKQGPGTPPTGSFSSHRPWGGGEG